jgi:predicted amidohydrolase YtcJ
VGLSSRKGLRCAWLLVAAVFALPAWADDERCSQGRALRLVNGKIHTMDAKDRVVSSVLIKDGRFAAVGHGGDDDGDECTKTINLRGRTAVPGIIDNHNHIILLGLRPGRDTRLEFANSIPEALATLAARATDAKPGEWVTAIGGFHRNQFFLDPQPIRFPTLEELTKAVPDHPVFIMESFSGPGATNALGKQFFETLGIPVGADGFMQSSMPGPTPGTTIFPCQDALFALRQMQTRDSMLQGLQDAMAFAAGVGVTTHLDQGGFPAALNNTDGAAHFDRYRAYDSLRVLYDQGKLSNRIWLNFLHLEERPDTPELQARLLNVFNDFGDDMVRILGIGEFTAGPFIGYPGTPQWINGTRMVAAAGWRNENHSLNIFNDWVRIIDGWQAIHDELAAPSNPNRNPDGITKLRWVLAHVPVITPDYVQKLKNLGGGISVVGAWRWLTGSGVANGPPFRTILATGIPTGMSSDGMQISLMSPWVNLYYVVTGKNARGQLINAAQTLGRNDALRLYTANNGWFLNAEDKLGTIEEGKLADVLVLSADYFSERAVPDEKIKDLHAVLTIVGGKVVHDDLDGKLKAYWKAGLP